MSQLRRALVLAGLLCVAVNGQVIDEYRLKAEFLFNFSKFVDWPSQAFKSSAAPFTICVLGKNPFGDALYAATKGKTVEGRALSVLDVVDVQQARLCHIVFVSGSERKRFRSILSDLKGSATLTVGEEEGFSEEGGVVSFKIERGSIRLQINVTAATQQHLRISSKLLSLAEIVKN